MGDAWLPTLTVCLWCAGDGRAAEKTLSGSALSDTLSDLRPDTEYILVLYPQFQRQTGTSATISGRTRKYLTLVGWEKDSSTWDSTSYETSISVTRSGGTQLEENAKMCFSKEAKMDKNCMSMSTQKWQLYEWETQKVWVEVLWHGYIIAIKS